MYTGHEDEDSPMNTRPESVSTNPCKLVQDVGSLYLDGTLSDVTFVVGEEKIPAHKIILALKSEYFKTLFKENSDKKEITISNALPESFRFLLKYIYTDTIIIPSTHELILQLLILAQQYCLKGLMSSLTKHIYDTLDAKNVIFFINEANSNDLKELRDACQSFMDANALEVLSSDLFNDLSQESLIQILKCESFAAPKSEILKSVGTWCQEHKDIDNLISVCVSLSLITTSELMSMVLRNMENPQNSLKKFSEIIEKSLFRTVLDENIATVERGAKIISHVDTIGLLAGNTDVNKFVQHKIDGKNGIIIRLNAVYNINYIRMMLYEAENRYYSYYIETSLDQKEWHRIIDYSSYACRSVQKLYFDPQRCQYIKVVGVKSSSGSDFRLVFFEAFHKSNIPKTKNGVVCPDENVATPENRAIVLEGVNPQHLLDGNHNNYSFHIPGNSLIVQLAQPYMISSMRLFLYSPRTALSSSNYKYFIATSVDKTNWEIVIDRRNQECSSWQDLHFAEKVVVFIKITGTYNSWGNSIFCCYHFECSSANNKS